MEAEATKQSRLIGAILVENGLISRDQLARALEIQKEAGGKLGEIVVAEFDVPRIALAGVLAEQWAAIDGTSSPRSIKPAASLRVVPAPVEDPTSRRPIGSIFLELGFITPEQLDAALERQRETGERIGEVLVEQGSLTRLDLASALAEQWSSLEKLRPPAPVADPPPWQNGSPVVHAGGQEQEDAPTRDNPLLTDLAERLRVIERTTATSLTQEDLSLAQLDLRAALGGLAERLDEVLETTAVDGITESLSSLTARLDALEREPVAPEVVVLREEFEELRSSASTGDALADVIAAVERLEARPGQSGEIASLAEEIAALTDRVDELTGLDELRERIDTVAGQARSAETGVEGLAGRIDALVALEARLDEVAARIPAEGALNDLREELSALAADRAEVATPGRDDDTTTLTSRIDELAARYEDTSGTPASDLLPRVDALALRVDELATQIPASSTANTDDLGARLESLEEWQREDDQATVDPAALEDLRAQVSALAERHDSIEPLEGRLGELEARIAELPAATQRRDEMRQITESTAAEHATLGADAVIRSELDGELAEVRSRLDELARLPHEDAVLRERVDAMAERLDSVGSLESGIIEVGMQLADAEAVRVADALANGARLFGIEASASSHLEALADLDGRLAALAADPGKRLDDDALAGDVAEPRTRIETLATQAVTAELGDRVSELADRAEALAGESRSSLSRSADDLNGRLDELGLALGTRLDELTERLGSFVAREELDAAAARHVQWFQAELVALREAGDARATILEASVADVELARQVDQHASRSAMDESLQAVRLDLLEQQGTLASQLQAQLADYRSELDRARSERKEEHASACRLESLLEQGLAALSTRITEEVAGARVAAEQETGLARAEAASLSSRIDEILGMRYVDLQAGRLADERLAEQIDAVAELRENDGEVVRRETADLASRLDSVSGTLQAETAAVRAIAEGANAQLGDVQRQRLEDLATAGLAGAELAARLDDLALRTAESAFEVERGLRDELVALAARVESRAAAEIEEREELRGELERLASSMGWRLERIEESLASDDSAALRETVSDLERRLEGQSELGEAQVKATERALRKGLASLGERLIESESAYVEAGNTLRRSIERLGAAVVEADARMADQIPVMPLEGCVAFAPTADGYRLVEMPGTPPEVGSVVELVAVEGPMVVTRYGRSPLPFDGRPCAYLDRG